MKTQINPLWSIDKIKEEYALALSNKILKKTKNTKVLVANQTKPQIINIYEGKFSDGTRIKIAQTNYDWQNSKLYFNYISYMQIK